MSASHGDVGLTMRQATELFGKMRAALEGNNLVEAEAMLKQLKLKLIALPSFLSPGTSSSTRLAEFMLTREILETAVLLYCRKRDMSAFDSHLDLLKPYYGNGDFIGLAAPASERRLVISGLNLLRLLVGHRLADFHSYYEVMPREEQNSLYIKFPVTLERYLAEGSFNKLLQARAKAPSNEYLPMLDMLEHTVRTEVAKCVPAAYTQISADGAKQLLMLQNDEQLAGIAEKHQWRQSKSEAQQQQKKPGFVFEDAVARVETIVPFKRVLTEGLIHVKQLQDVV